jgi:6-phosphogluconate dehydrogenase (decarboxylating)
VKIGVAGLGRMGSAIAKRLIDVGHDVVVWNRDAEKVRPLADHGAYGSIFPIEKLWTDYASLYRTFREAMEPFTEIQQQKILHDTAKRLYGL